MKQHPFRPRDLLSKEVAGICGVARLTDKARAAYAGEIGKYKYGADSEQDTGILSFLGISEAAFQEAAVRIDNDIKLGAWILDNCGKSSKEISAFNRKVKLWWQNKMLRGTYRDTYSKRRRQLAQAKENRHLSGFPHNSWFPH